MKTKQIKTPGGLTLESNPLETGITIAQLGINPNYKYNLVNKAIKNMLSKPVQSISEKDVFGRGSLTKKNFSPNVNELLKIEQECKRLRSKGVKITRAKIKEISSRILKG